MSHPSPAAARARRARRRRTYVLELVLGLAVIAAGTGLLVLDRQAPDLASGAAGATASPPPAGADGAGGDRPGSADAAAPQA
ncbi:hypothetical protein ACFPZ0_18060, partial [Streptomonospora nanhaiensis]